MCFLKPVFVTEISYIPVGSSISNSPSTFDLICLDIFLLETTTSAAFILLSSWSTTTPLNLPTELLPACAWTKGSGIEQMANMQQRREINIWHHLLPFTCDSCLTPAFSCGARLAFNLKEQGYL